ncbi:MAG: YgiQ family radical SAM protein [Desulfovibrionaceae bacterium]|nr:YgiQ family radical SAM protein [Desulfovibrionaceae bacterium]
MSLAEMQELGWESLDVLLVSGDAYVDHPSFAAALLGRLLVSQGFRTAIIAQPNWKDLTDIKRLGRPRLFCGIGSGAVDSLLANYTAFRQKRKSDAYTPGGVVGKRPNRACIVYTNLVKAAFPGLPVVLGGIEASTRRLTHYDFWSDQLRKPILFDAKADLLVYGMGERAILEIAWRLACGQDLLGILGTAFITKVKDGLPHNLSPNLAQLPKIQFPSHSEILAHKEALVFQAKAQERHMHEGGSLGYELLGDRCVVVTPPAKPLTTKEMDFIYGLSFARCAHPKYQEEIPAALMIKTSLTSHRGCGGGCSFCSLSLHQGRRISSRSKESLLAEARILVQEHGAKRRGGGVAISDVGGPTANMWGAICLKDFKCKRESCCYPKVCPFFKVKPAEHIELLKAISKVPGVKQVRVASGIRSDLALKDLKSLEAYVALFTGGQLKLAPEHCVDKVLKLMRKPKYQVFEDFLEVFKRQNKLLQRKQYVVPYLLSAFPGCTLEDMRLLGDWLKARNWTPKQTQCFIPTPGTLATAMFYAEIDAQGKPLYVAKTDKERLEQHRVLYQD